MLLPLVKMNANEHCDWACTGKEDVEFMKLQMLNALQRDDHDVIYWCVGGISSFLKVSTHELISPPLKAGIYYPAGTTRSGA
jgi:hypothetical protein